jgi:hypothetical protein
MPHTINPISLVDSNESVEWYTPPRYLRLVRHVLGAIDLDPASHPTAQANVQATRYFTRQDDGMTQTWHGRIFLNPPYGLNRHNKSSQNAWLTKLIAEHNAGRVTAAIALVRAAIGYIWYDKVWARPHCITARRINFIPGADTSARSKGSHTASAFVYLGAHIQRFASTFIAVGHVIDPVNKRYYPYTPDITLGEVSDRCPKEEP